MANNREIMEYLLKISLFSHPDELISPLIHKLTQKFPHQVTLHNTSSKTENIYIIQSEVANWYLTIYLVQPISINLSEKLVSHFYTSIAGAIILFSNNVPKSFEAAKAFYHQLRKVNGNVPVLVTFVEMTDKTQKPVIDEPEILDNAPNVIYYGIKEHDEQVFFKIIGTFISRYFGIQ